MSTDRVESWRKGLEPWELGLMETVLRRKLKRWDYAISGDGERPSPKLVGEVRQGGVRAAVGDAQALGRGEPGRGDLDPARGRPLTSRQLELAATSPRQR